MKRKDLRVNTGKRLRVVCVKRASCSIDNAGVEVCVCACVCLCVSAGIFPLLCPLCVLSSFIR